MRIFRTIVVGALFIGGCGGPKQAPIEGPAPPVGEAQPLPPAAGDTRGALRRMPGLWLAKPFLRVKGSVLDAALEPQS